MSETAAKNRPTEEINNNMDQIARLVRESSVGAQESAKACHSLSGLAFDLQKLVAEFEVEGAGKQASSGYAPSSDDRRKAFAAAAGS